MEKMRYTVSHFYHLRFDKLKEQSSFNFPNLKWNGYKKTLSNKNKLKSLIDFSNK